MPGKWSGFVRPHTGIIVLVFFETEANSDTNRLFFISFSPSVYTLVVQQNEKDLKNIIIPSNDILQFLQLKSVSF